MGIGSYTSYCSGHNFRFDLFSTTSLDTHTHTHIFFVLHRTCHGARNGHTAFVAILYKTRAAATNTARYTERQRLCADTNNIPTMQGAQLKMLLTNKYWLADLEGLQHSTQQQTPLTNRTQKEKKRHRQNTTRNKSNKAPIVPNAGSGGQP